MDKIFSKIYVHETKKNEKSALTHRFVNTLIKKSKYINSEGRYILYIIYNNKIYIYDFGFKTPRKLETRYLEVSMNDEFKLP